MPDRNSSVLRPLDLASLRAAYDDGLQPAQVLREIYAAIAKQGEKPVWISLRPEAEALAIAETLRLRRDKGEALPLFGVPFAVKDNIDVAGLLTTAGCPAFAYSPQHSAFTVERLEAAGAIVIGKTNLDQFATGLVGTRSPYGIPSSVFDESYISGGSSSGSGVAVAAGLVSFALGTDTAGSGRVPAAFNNIVGLKPTRGWLSTRGVVPACRSLDCVSVFAGTVEDAMAVARLAGGFDPDEPFSRAVPAERPRPWPEKFRFAVSAAPLEFFGDREAEALYRQTVDRLESLGGAKVEIDLTPFLEAAVLLYGGPWVAERFAAIKSFAESQPDAMDPTVRGIILAGAKPTAADAFAASYRLAELKRRAEPVWTTADVLLLPTAPTTYRIAEVLADPRQLNINLGRYTNFVNLLDLSAIAVPAGFRGDGLPFGVTLMGRAFDDAALAALAGRLHRTMAEPKIGATRHPVLPAAPSATPVAEADELDIAVVGAHLSDEPLNYQLTELGGRLARAARTANGYRLYALAGTVPPKPGLVFDGSGRGGIEVEVWRLPRQAVGAFIAQIPPPLGIATLRLDDGSAVKGFICEAHAVVGAEDITALGGWRAYLRGLRAATV